MNIGPRQKKLLETEAVAVATVNKDGSSNVIPIGYAKVVSNKEIVITDNFMKITNNNIRNDSRICLAVWTKDWKKGYKFVGKAEYFASGKWVKFVKEMGENKEMPAKGAVLVTVSNIYDLG